MPISLNNEKSTAEVAGKLLPGRYSLVILIILILTAFFYRGKQFEKNYYERISGIKFPGNYEVLETFDNGEWLTGTVFRIRHSTLIKFIADNHFMVLLHMNDLKLLSNGYLKNYKASFKTPDGIYYLSRSSQKNNWIYVADLNNNMLWAEIGYPDWGGD